MSFAVGSCFCICMFFLLHAAWFFRRIEEWSEMKPSGGAITSEWLDLCGGFTGVTVYGLGSKYTDESLWLKCLFSLTKTLQSVRSCCPLCVRTYFSLSGWSVKPQWEAIWIITHLWLFALNNVWMNFIGALVSKHACQNGPLSNK